MGEVSIPMATLPGDDGVCFNSVIPCATERRAACNALGKSFLRFSARRRIPLHAVGLR